MLKHAEQVRLIADYLDDSVQAEDAAEMVEQAGRFVAAMRELVVGS